MAFVEFENVGKTYQMGEVKSTPFTMQPSRLKKGSWW